MQVLKRMLAFAAVSVALVQSPAQAAVPTHDVDHALRTIFRKIDRNGDGHIGAVEINRYMGHVFAAMDADHDGRLSLAEFNGLSLGLRPLAVRYGRAQAYDVARARIFRRWRSTGSETMTRAQFRLGVKREFGAVGGHPFSLSYERFRRARFVQELVASLR